MIKKIAIIIPSLLILACSIANAQVFIMDDDEAFSLYRDGADDSFIGGYLPNVPIQNLTIDQYAPLGGGEVLLLGLLGGAYLLGKRRKKEDN